MLVQVLLAACHFQRLVQAREMSLVFGITSLGLHSHGASEVSVPTVLVLHLPCVPELCLDVLDHALLGGVVEV